MRRSSSEPDVPVEESLTLPRGSGAPGAARRFVRRLAWVSEQREVVELLVSELVTNAVRHARGDIEVTIGAIIRGRIRVSIGDGSPSRPAIREPKLEGGHGLRLVEALADRWGVDQRVGGKTVWFEILAGSGDA